MRSNRWWVGAIVTVVSLSLGAGVGRAQGERAGNFSVMPMTSQSVEGSGVSTSRNAVDALAPQRNAAHAVTETQASIGAGEDLQTVQFPLTTILVEGNSILEQAKIDRLLELYKGPNRRMRDVEQVRTELEKLYHEAGYPTVLVNIPEQTIEDGLVRLQVVEGHLYSITVTGNEHYSWSNIRTKLPSLTPGALVYEPTFVKELAAVNGNPDLNVTPLLKAGSVLGTVDLELKVKDRLPVHGKLEADNRGPITTPRNRLIAEIQHTNLFGNDEILTLNTVQTPQDWGAIQNYGASFVYPVIWPNHLLSVYASRSESNSVLAGGAISVGGGGDVAIAGNATIAGARYLFPILSGREQTHQLSIGIDYKRLNKTEASFPDGGTSVVLTPVQYTPVSIGYTGFYPDRFGLTKASFTAKGYVGGLIPGGHKEDFGGDPVFPFRKPGNRKGSTGTFAVLQGGVGRSQPLPGDFVLDLSANGQWATQPLIPAEQFFAGGFDTVRGYVQFEAIGDHAIRGRAELTTPEVLKVPIDRIWQRRRSSDFTLRLRFATFYDAAHIWVAQAPVGQTSRFRLEGAGFGIRLKFPKDVGQLILDSGWALRDTLNTKRGDNFVHFSVGLAF
ncbi:MAG: ShlB/FhaC/HecB family hemolysin secretion/activation protein [Nitrospira sp.]|nr:ShlB/FhaC/HecB family hemolysin secretion/activation protein [Nitrospira sp.]